MKKWIFSLIFSLFISSCMVFYAQVEVEPGYDYNRFRDAGITLNVYNWGEYISNGTDGSLDVIKEFEELTGIHVNYNTFDTNESMYAKIKSGGANYDVIIPSDYMVAKMIQEDMLEKLNFDNIPNIRFIDETSKNLVYDPTNEYSVPYTWGLVGIIYNETMVDPEDLKQGWSLLWDEKYTKNILMYNNSRDAFAIAAKIQGKSINPSTIKEIDDSAELLKQQKNVVQAYVMDEVFDKMSGEEAAIAPYYVGDGITMMRDNPNLKIILPKEGTNRYSDAMCIPKGAKNKEAAEMFINFMTETAVAKANIEHISYSTPHKEVKKQLPPEIRDNPMLYPPKEYLQLCESMLMLPSEINEAMDRAWSDIRSYDTSGSGWVFPITLLLMLIASAIGYAKKAKRRKNRIY